MYQNFIKRGLDIICSLIGLILLSPVFIALTFLILIDDGYPIFFLKSDMEEIKSPLLYGNFAV